MNYFYSLAQKISQGHSLTKTELTALLDLPYTKVRDLFPGADMLREKFFGNRVSLCSITNAKSGKCSEDCSFCAQSVHHGRDVQEYPLKTATELADLGKTVAGTGSGIKRYSMVASGRGLVSEELEVIAGAARELDSAGIRTCASLGILSDRDFDLLKGSGLKRYHHNLETAPGFFPQICTTHNFSQRVETVNKAKKAGFSVCSGGVFGLGETDAQVVELALLLKELEVDAVPVNFLIPIPGTPLENTPVLTPLRCLKIIGLLRYILADREIIVCGGRIQNLRELHPFVFMAGASGIMTGNYLTRQGRLVEEDLRLIKDLGLEPDL